MKISVDVKDIDRGFNDMLLLDVRLPKAVDIGLFGDTDSDIVKYASANEFGVGKSASSHGGTQMMAMMSRAAGVKVKYIPERAFMRTTFDREKDNIIIDVKKMIDMYSKGYVKDVKKYFSIIGSKMKTAIQKTITTASTWAVPNAPATIKKKKSSKPLIDSGRMRAAITYKVIK